MRVQPETAAMDLGYDTQPVHDACHDAGCLPIIPLKKTTAVVQGKHKPPGRVRARIWRFAGTDFKRRLKKWRCPSGKCQPAGVWRKASRLHPRIPRETKRWGDLYRGPGSVERAFGRLKHDYGLGPLRVRGIERVQLHAGPLHPCHACLRLARARAVPLAA